MELGKEDASAGSSQGRTQP